MGCLSHPFTRKFLQFCFSNGGLCIIVATYCVGGAFMFQAIEWGAEAAMYEEQQVDHDYMSELLNTTKWKIFKATIYSMRRMGAEYPGNRTAKEFKRLLDNYHDEFFRRYNQSGYAGFRPEVTNSQYSWEISSVILFTATILTTIGYGHIAPKTEIGRLAMILYALIAVPLMAMFLTKVGNEFADLIERIYHRGCCFFCWKRREISHGRDPNAPEDLENLASLENRSKSAWGNSENEKIPMDEFSSSEEEMMYEDDEMEDEDSGDYGIPATLALMIVVFYVSFGSLLFHFWEDWTVIESLYFTWVTLMTIGFGDYVPAVTRKDVKGRLETCASALYIVVGLVIMATGISMITQAVHDRALKIHNEIKRKAKELKEKMDQNREKEDEDDLIHGHQSNIDHLIVKDRAPTVIGDVPSVPVDHSRVLTPIGESIKSQIY